MREMALYFYSNVNLRYARGMVSFTCQLRYPLNTKLGGHQGRCGRFGELLSLPGIERRPARIVVTIPNMLNQVQKLHEFCTRVVSAQWAAQNDARQFGLTKAEVFLVIKTHFRLFLNIPQIYDTHFGYRQQSRTAAVCNKINDEVKTEFKKYKKTFACCLCRPLCESTMASNPSFRRSRSWNKTRESNNKFRPVPV